MSWPALNQTVCALRFLYGVTLKQADLPERIPYARTPRKLPVVLGAQGLRMKEAGEHLLHVTVIPGGHFAAPLETGL